MIGVRARLRSVALLAAVAAAASEGRVRAGDPQSECDSLMKAPLARQLPKGFSNPKATLSREMTPGDRAAGVVCKVTFLIEGPDEYDAVRYRVYPSAAQAKEGFRRLAEMQPDVHVFRSDIKVQGALGDAPCLAYRWGDRPLSFVMCSALNEDAAIVATGVASHATTENAVSNEQMATAGKLLEAAVNASEGGELDDVFKAVFGDHDKK